MRICKSIILTSSLLVSVSAYPTSEHEVSNYIESVTGSDYNLKSVFYIEYCQLKIDDLANSTLSTIDLKEVSFEFKGEGNEYHPYIFETRCRNGSNCISRKLTPSHTNYDSSWSLSLSEMRHTVSEEVLGINIVEALNYSSKSCRGENSESTSVTAVEVILNNHLSPSVNQELYAAVSSASNTTDLQLINNLIKQGADVNYNPEGSPSMLHLSMLNYELSNLLLNNGANVDAKYSSGNTVMHRLAYSSGEHGFKMLQLYLSYHANMTLTNDNDVSVIDLYKQEGNWSMLDAMPSEYACGNVYVGREFAAKGGYLGLTNHYIIEGFSRESKNVTIRTKGSDYRQEVKCYTLP